MLEHVPAAERALREYFPERSWAVRLVLKEENARHSILEKWQERQLVHFVEILTSLSGDLYRAHQQKMISTLAWVTRNLLELSVWIEFCTASDTNAKRFDEDAMRDMLGWSNAIQGMFTDKHDEEHKKLSGKIDDLKNFAVSKGMAPLDDDFKQVREAADELGRTNFRWLYKLYSKFAHPTAWIVHSASSVEADEDFRDMFFTDGVDLAIGSLTRIRQRVLAAFPELQSNE